MLVERVYRPQLGWFPLFLAIALILGGPIVMTFLTKSTDSWQFGSLLVSGILMILVGLVMLFGLVAIAPNDSRVLLLFGKYHGTVKESGFWWVNPFYSKKSISLRIRNFDTGSTMIPEHKDAHGHIVQAKTRAVSRLSKVNDRDGNPIEISAVVVWRVVNTAEALFEVDDYEDFVAVQSDAALRNLASRHPYDSEDHETSLRGNRQEVCDQLRHDIQERLDVAGVEVIEARLSHLAYAPEIAAAMLQRQQAQAVVAARTRIVDGAVGMVEMALDQLAKKNVVQLDDERRAAMVSNLLVVLCGDRQPQPVLNAGTIY